MNEDADTNAGTDTNNDLIWYACYGSSLSYDRFLCYLEGSKAAGASRKNKAARNSQEPVDERAYFIPHALYIAQKSLMWDRGGVAFLKPTSDPKVQTWGRLYLICREQCEDIFRQDNAQADAVLDWDCILNQQPSATTIGEGWYNTVLHIGELEGKPIITFTSSQIHNVNSPSESYMQMFIDGLHDCYGIGKEGVKSYLKNIPGIKGGKYSNKKIDQMWERALEHNGCSKNNDPHENSDSLESEN